MSVLVAAAVVRHQGRILLTKRPQGTHLEGFWEFPGGKVEPNEDPRVAVARECREECAIELEVGAVIDVIFHRFETKSVLLLFYACTLSQGESGDVQHLGVSDHVWALPEELHQYPLPPADAPLLKKLL